MKNLIKWAVFLIIEVTLLFSCTLENRSHITHLPFRISEGGDWGLISTNGKIIISGAYENPPYAATDGIFILRAQNGKFEYFKAESSPVKIGGEYIKAAAFSESLAPVLEKEDLISVINGKGEVVFSLEEVNGKKIVSCSSFSNGIALIEDENGLKGFIDKKGRVIIEPQYDEASDFKSGFAVVLKKEFEKKYWQIINKKGEIIYELSSETYETHNLISSSLLGFTNSVNSDSWGFISTNGEEVVKPSRDYYNVRPVLFNKFIYSDGSKIGVAGIKGERVLPADYDDIEHSGKNHFLVKKGDVWYIVNKENKETGSSDFTEHTGNINGNLFIKVRDKFISVNSKGVRNSEGEYSEVIRNLPPYSVKLSLLNFRKSISDLFQIVAPGQLWRLKIGTPAEEVTGILGSGSPELLKSTRTLTTKRVAEDIESSITVGFSAEISLPVTEREMLRDMWGRAYWDNVIKGYAFNENSSLQDIYANIKLLGKLKGREKDIAIALSEFASASGFNLKEKEEKSIQMTTDTGRVINISFSQNEGVNIVLR